MTGLKRARCDFTIARRHIAISRRSSRHQQESNIFAIGEAQDDLVFVWRHINKGRAPRAYARARAYMCRKSRAVSSESHRIRDMGATPLA